MEGFSLFPSRSFQTERNWLTLVRRFTWGSKSFDECSDCKCWFCVYWEGQVRNLLVGASTRKKRSRALNTKGVNCGKLRRKLGYCAYLKILLMNHSLLRLFWHSFGVNPTLRFETKFKSNSSSPTYYPFKSGRSYSTVPYHQIRNYMTVPYCQIRNYLT